MRSSGERTMLLYLSRQRIHKWGLAHARPNYCQPKMATTKCKQAGVTNFFSPAPKRRAHEEPPSGSLADNEVMQLPHSPVDQETGPLIESEALTGEAGALT